jgi:methyl-accepting chemotaxis protein
MPTKMATALRKGADSATTAREAALEAMQKLGGKPSLVICYASPAYDYEQVVSTLRRETAGAPLIGCSSAGEFTEDKVENGSIAIALLRSDTISFHVASQTGLKDDSAACLRGALAKLPATVPGHPYRNFLIYHDGLVGRGEEAILAAMTEIGLENRVFGGAAGDDLHLQKTVVFCNDSVLVDAVALCLMASVQRIPTTLKHGHEPLSPTLTITKAKDNVLYEVDGRPAWEVWKQHCGQAVKDLLGLDINTVTKTEEVFSVLGSFEVGLHLGHDYKMRSPLSKNPDGSLNFTCTIFEGSKFRIMKTEKPMQVESARQAAAKVMSEPISTPPAGALVFDCAARLMILGQDFPKSVEAMRSELPSLPLLGYEAYGEICLREHEVSGFHNTTTVITVLPQ